MILNMSKRRVLSEIAELHTAFFSTVSRAHPSG